MCGKSGQLGPLSTPVKQNRYYRSIRTREEPARNRRKVSNTLKTRRSVPTSCIRAPTLAVCPSTMTSRRNPGRGARNPYRRAGQDPWLPRQMRRSPVESTRPRLAGSRAACPACPPAQALASHRAGLSNRRLSDTPACSGHGPGRAAPRGAAKRFGIAPSTAIKWVRAWQRTGCYRPRPQSGDRRSQRIEARAEVVLALVE